jgi:hypothetical protein
MYHLRYYDILFAIPQKIWPPSVSYVGFSISQKLTGTEPQIYNSPFPNYSAKSIFLVLSLLHSIKNKEQVGILIGMILKIPLNDGTAVRHNFFRLAFFITL